jgi:hypothetical protein
MPANDEGDALADGWRRATTKNRHHQIELGLEILAVSGDYPTLGFCAPAAPNAAGATRAKWRRRDVGGSGERDVSGKLT